MSMQLNIDAPWITLSTPIANANNRTYTHGAVTDAISRRDDNVTDRLNRLEKVLVDVLKNHPDLILKYPDLIKDVLGD